MNNEGIKELRIKALRTNDQSFIKENYKNPDMGVRINIAKNQSTPTDLINELAKDPTTNVIYTALNNRRCTVKRELPKCSLTKCVVCNNTGDDFSNCSTCKAEESLAS